MQPIHWYPGHMAKAKKQLTELVKFLDVILEVRDARAPLASHNSDVESILVRRPCIIILNKTDMADPKATMAWIEWFRHVKGLPVIAVNSKNGEGINLVWKAINDILTEKHIKRSGRVGVVGIPNVGKSSVLNRLLGTGSAKTGNLPGITRGKQWVRRNDLEILDTPGLLPPKIVQPDDGFILAILGTIREEIIPVYDLALILLEKYGRCLFNGEKQPLEGTGLPEEQLQWFANRRNFILKGGEPDIDRAAKTLLKEFRDCKLGRITLELPPVEVVDGL